MSDSKSIQIEIAATGGDASAAEIRKVEDVIQSETKSIASLEQELLDATKAYKQAETGSTEFAEASKRVEIAKRALTTSANSVTSSMVSMRMGIQNASYQIQDIAVQAEMGTPALRILGQQVPQLLGSFGMWGAVAGAVIGIGAPLAASFFKSGEDAATAAGKVKNYEDKLEDLRIAAQKATNTKALARNQEFIDSLDDEEEGFRKLNDEINRGIQLLQAKRRAETEMFNAQAALDLAKIDADPNMSDANKIRARAKVQEDIASNELKDKKFNLETKVFEADKTAENKSSEESRNAADIAALKEELAKQKAEAARLNGIIADAQRAKEGIKAVDKEIAETEKQQRLAQTSALDPMSPSPQGGVFKEELQALKDKRAALQEVADKDINSRERDALSGKGGVIEQTTKALKDAEDAAKALAEAAEKAKKDAEAVRAQANVENTAAESVYQKNSQARKITSDTQADKIEKEEQAKQKQKDDEALRKAEKKKQDDEREAERKNNAEAKVGRDAVKLLPPDVSEKFRRAVTDVANGLQDGDQGGEVKELAELLHSLATAMKNRGQHDDSRFEAIQREISNINSRAKISRDGR